MWVIGYRWLAGHLCVETRTSGDDYQLLLGVNGQSVSPLMMKMDPSSTPFQDIVIGSHTWFGIGDVSQRCNHIMKCLWRHRRTRTRMTCVMNVFIWCFLKLTNYIINRVSNFFSLLTLTLYIFRSYFYILWNILKIMKNKPHY